METRNKQEADQVLRDQKLSNAEKARRSADFNPGLRPEADFFGVPGDGPDDRYYPARDNVTGEREGGSDVPVGGTDADRKEGTNVEELDRDENRPLAQGE